MDEFKAQRTTLAERAAARGTDSLNLHNKLSDITDKTLQAIAQDITARKHGAAEASLPCIVAVGGYGRQELAHFSDIDVLFVSEDALTANGKKLVEQLADALWLAGVKLSYSVRTIAECAAAMDSDLHFTTSLLEKRLIWGAKPLYKQLEAVVKQHFTALPQNIFVAAKLAEQDARHKKMGDSRFQLQPNLKESKGALRDIQTLFWLSNFLYGAQTPDELAAQNILTAAEADTLTAAHRFFWAVRCHLHLITGRADDRLSFDVQPEVASRMGYEEADATARAERFMKTYFRLASEIGHLTRILCADLEARALAGGATAGTKKLSLADAHDGFPVRNNRLTVADAEHFRHQPVDILRIFRTSQLTGHDIHPDALRAIRNTLPDINLAASRNAYAIFFDIMLDVKGAEKTMRRLNEANVLTALIPDFSNIFAHMQYDMYHFFTADEHTIRAVGMMHKIENGDLAETAPLATSLFPKIHSRRALYAAMFMHDIAKGTGGEHSRKGAEIALRLCPLLGLSPEETETVSWLVEQHLLMTFAAFKRDLNDPKSIEDFIGAVQSPERLKLIAILTTADIMAVGPERWNNWKSGLLSELYYKSSESMSGTPKDRDDNDQFMILQKKTRRLLVGDQSAPLQYLADYAPKYFWLSFSAEAIAGFVRALHKNTGDRQTVIKVTPNPDHDFTEVFVFTPDRKGLFATLSGAMAAAGASIVDARIFTLSNGMALDIFQIQNIAGHVYDNSGYLQRTLKAALAGKLDVDAEIFERQKNMPRKNRLFKAQPRVIIDNNASVSNTVIEVNGKDRPGFLYGITSALTQAGLQISAAKITTFGTRAVDVFYVKDAFGLKIIHREKLAVIEKTLRAALEKNQ
ncbi:MAG: [protein-PII] uridylyltransferase [Micavibrio sp.]|nr:[protein-PII] uridylyltransferase [Micavibrio sp.]